MNTTIKTLSWCVYYYFTLQRFLSKATYKEEIQAVTIQVLLILTYYKLQSPDETQHVKKKNTLGIVKC